MARSLNYRKEIIMPRIHFTGCCLIDYIYDSVSFASGDFIPFLSQANDDGGIVPGKLVFADAFEAFAGISAEQAVGRIGVSFGAPRKNLGGPAAVAAVHAAQVLNGEGWTVHFFGGRGGDEAGHSIGSFFRSTPIKYDDSVLPGDTPVTWVFSDPSWDEGRGERAFLGKAGMAAAYAPSMLGSGFFDADIHAYGGTALVPGIHGELSRLLKTGKDKGSLQVVHTVYDFYSQRRDPRARWPMGDGDGAYRHIDLLITDREEARRFSGMDDPGRAIEFFLGKGTGAVIITDGSKDLSFASAGGRFKPLAITTSAVSREVSRLRKEDAGRLGDTTGCGDNFAGGVIAGLALQLKSGEELLDLQAAVPHGIAAGGFACTCIGGPWFETRSGEKKELLKPFYN